LCYQHEFLHVCICPYLHELFSIVDDNIPQFSVLAIPILVLLGVAIESLQGCDWSTLSCCEPIPLLFSVCRLLNATRWGNDDFSSVVREQALPVLSGLVQLTARHAHHVPCKLFVGILYSFFH